MLAPLKKDAPILLILLLIFGHFFLSSKDNTIDHSREVSIATSIEAFHAGMPLHTSNRHIYNSLLRVSKEYESVYKSHPQFEPVETTWEDQGHYYWVYYMGGVKRLLGLSPLKYSDLHLIQLGGVLILALFAFSISKMVDPFLNWALLAQLGFLFFTRNLNYTLISHFAYAMAALYLVYLLIGFSFLWNRSGPSTSGQSAWFYASFFLGLSFPLFIKEIRSDCGFMGLFAFGSIGLILLGKAFIQGVVHWRNLAAVAFLSVGVCAFPAGLHRWAQEQRNKACPLSADDIGRFVGGHPIWISIYTGFGYLPNSLGFRVSDEDAMQAVLNEKGPLPYMTKSFEATLREIVIKRIKSQPSFLVKTIGVKIFDLFRVRHPTVPIGGLRGFFDPLILLSLAQLFISLYLFRRRLFQDRIYYLGLPFLLLLGLVPVLIREPYMTYSSLFNNLLFIHILLLIVLFVRKRKQTGDSGVLQKAFTDFSSPELNLF